MYHCNKERNDVMLTGIEIFSGAGGLAKGLEESGIRHRAFVEWNKDACKTLRQNFSESFVYEGDVREFDFMPYCGVDIIAGGPPCQPFSLGGKALGFEDKRDMFPHAISAIRKLKPKAFIFENVKGLLRDSFKEYYEFIILQLQYPDFPLENEDWRKDYECLKSVRKSSYNGLRYNVTYQLVNAADYGVPQKRERVIIVGFRADMKIEWTFPSPTHSKDSLLWSQFVTGDYWKRHNIDCTYSESKAKMWRDTLFEKYGLWQPSLLPWVTIRDVISDLSCNILKESKEYPGHTGSFIDEPSKTIKAGDHGVPGGENMVRFADGSMRYLTIEEAKRIQTFPDEYFITGSWTEGMRQLGNAVPVQLAYIVGKSVVDALNEN